jgi:hypothetical protein
MLSHSFAKRYDVLVIIFSYLKYTTLSMLQILLALSSPKPLHNVQHHTTKWDAQGSQQSIAWRDGPQS